MSPILITFLLIIVYGPMLWIKFTFWKYRQDLAEIPGTGGELASHLIKRFGLEGVGVEKGEPNQDHYSPTEKMVRLSPDNFDGRSLTAIAVAAHEVGHAVQFHRNDPTCKLYTKYFPVARAIQRFGIGLISLPIFSTILAAPRISILALGLVATVMISSAVIHLIILPQEWDASFNKALPMLDEGEYIDAKHLPKVRGILRAAALTYFAGALADVVRCWRWGRLFRP
jgi:hypothetical protein